MFRNFQSNYTVWRFSGRGRHYSCRYTKRLCY